MMCIAHCATLLPNKPKLTRRNHSMTNYRISWIVCATQILFFGWVYLNVKVGSFNNNRETIMGTYGLGTMTKNGEMFAGFISGTIFAHRNIHKVTWVFPNNHTQTQIDDAAIG